MFLQFLHKHIILILPYHGPPKNKTYECSCWPSEGADYLLLLSDGYFSMRLIMHNSAKTYVDVGRYIHIYIHAYVYTYLLTYIHTYIHTHTHTHTHIYVHTHTHTLPFLTSALDGSDNRHASKNTGSGLHCYSFRHMIKICTAPIIFLFLDPGTHLFRWRFSDSGWRHFWQKLV